MPTPVNTAKQCLNSEACHALDQAVLVARRRGHPQTTSLHAVSAFLTLSPSQLKEACIRARNAAFYPKVQLKALDFCLSVSLDRLPVSQPRVDEPHVSNSLMAAIKRSHANMRRHPENIMTVKNNQDQNLGTSLSSMSPSSSYVKVDLQHLIVSILDDPIVSRVFNDAGFGSFDVKLAILRPFQSLFRYPDPGPCRFQFPFSGGWDEEGEYRRIGEVLKRNKERNPLVVGVYANDIVKGFIEALERKKECVLPMDIVEIKVVCIEKDIVKFVSENWSDDAIRLWFREVSLMVEQCFGLRLMINVGNVRCFLGKDRGYEMDVVNFAVRKITKLLDSHGGRVCLIGSAADDQTYIRFMSRFPMIDKDWDLQPLPITSVKSLVGESCYKSSLLGSFVPFGGFFSSPSDLKGSLGTSVEYATSSNMFSGTFEQDITAFPKRRFMAVADHHPTHLSPRLQVTEFGRNISSDNPKAKGGTMLLSGTATGPGLQGKWDNIYMCHCQNHAPPGPRLESLGDSFRPPTGLGSCCVAEKIRTVNEITGATKASCKECDYGKINSCESVDSEKQSASQSSKAVSVRSLKNDNFLAKLSKSHEYPLPGGSCSPYCLCISGEEGGQTSSPSSGDSITTELGLELFSQASKQQGKVAADANRCHMTKCSNQVSLNSTDEPADNFKAIFKALFEKVGRQCEAVRVVSQIVAQSWTCTRRHQRSGPRGDIWLNFVGPDMFGKRKIALALAEILYGSKKYFLHIDLCSEAMVFHHTKVFGRQITNDYDTKNRGKTVTDHIAEELRKVPFCVAFLENVHSADPVAQHSLLQAFRNGKFSDSHGREVAITNRVFVLTSRVVASNSTFSFKDKPSKFPEERLARTKGLPLQLVVKGSGHTTSYHSSVISNTGKNTHDKFFVNKRKLNGTDDIVGHCVHTDHVKWPQMRTSMSLDLNLPAETTESDDTKYGDTGEGYGCDKYESWLEESSDKLDKTLVKVVFEPFDCDALATKVLKLVNASFYKVIHSKCLLEIEPRVMDQIMAGACLSDNDQEVEHWIDQVLSKGFAEVDKMHHLSAHSKVMLATCGVLHAEEQVLEAFLPVKIIIT